MTIEPELLRGISIRDPDDKTGRRCGDVHPEVGTCVRRAGHASRGEPWHHALSRYDPETHTADVWRWRT